MSSAQGYRQRMRESLRSVLYQWKSPDTEIYMHDQPAGCRAYVYRPETKEMLVVQYDGSFGLQLFIASKPMTACDDFCQSFAIPKSKLVRL